jgi:hypothetical protein
MSGDAGGKELFDFEIVAWFKRPMSLLDTL